MPALFPPRATWIARAALVAMIAGAIAIPIAAMAWVRTPWARGEHRDIDQPVPFDHRLHITGLRIDCRYCHFTADRGPVAGVPSTQQCVSCHSPVLMATNVMAPVRRSIATGQSIHWARVTQLPSFVYFDHAVHVNRGVGCETCHGRVDRMARVEQVVPLTMTWCVDCHRDPSPQLRPEAAITAMGWSQPSSGTAAAVRPAAVVRRLTTCTTCHR